MSRERCCYQRQSGQDSSSGHEPCTGTDGTASTESGRHISETPTDPIKRPRHYSGAHGVEAKEAMANMVNRPLAKAVVPVSPMAVFWWCAAFKYLWRWPFKNGDQDVSKCIECLKNMQHEIWVHNPQDGGDGRGME